MTLNLFKSECCVLICSDHHIEYHTLGSLKNRNLLSHSFGGCKSKKKASAGMVPSEASSPWLADSHLLCSHIPDVKFPLLIGHTGLATEELMASLQHTLFFKGLISKFSHLLRYWQRRGMEGTHSVHSTINLLI